MTCTAPHPLRHLIVRAERPDDAAAIAEAVKRAYAAVPYSDHREHIMVERLRNSDAYVPELSLVAEADGAVVGHILLTRATIEDGKTAITTLALAPLSVFPGYQRMGVGKRLVRTAHIRAAELGFGSILLVGIPGYYPRFGYRPLGHYPIALPFEAPPETCLVLPLHATGLDGVSGIVRYADAWLDH